MSGNGYGYYHPSTSQNYPDPNQAWSGWSSEQQYNNNARNIAQHHSNGLNHTNNHLNSYPVPNRSQNYYNPHRHFQQRRFNNHNQQYSGGQQQWQRNGYNKRPRPQETPGENGEPKNKPAKKKKKPLSQNIPAKKDWTLSDSEKALAVEKEYNKRFKNHSLIIKFPDQELNRDIVSKFHPSIENVHFQQPSTPRFCFVTLQESSQADVVIAELNKIKFGEGHLVAEFKKDREDDQNIGPEDIDPCTLYVGNLAQEVTKEDMVKTYPKGRRIDIGYAKKMKYTRYAFVSFKNIDDSIDAFKKTHSTQMYSKSLIVRFRRLHGTVGMPGETKVQSPGKRSETVTTRTQINNEVIEQTISINNDSIDNQINGADDTQSSHSEVDLSVVKREIDSSDDETAQPKRETLKDYESPFMPGPVNVVFKLHKPMIKTEIKTEDENAPNVVNEKNNVHSSLGASTSGTQTNGSRVTVKPEPQRSTVPVHTVKNEHNAEDESSDDDHGDCGLGDVNFSSLFNQLDHHSNQIESLRKWAP